jgi:hypothetical protein
MTNQKQLESFTAYCKANPNERFWQALRNWSEASCIMYRSLESVDDKTGNLTFKDEDSFYWENKNN